MHDHGDEPEHRHIAQSDFYHRNWTLTIPKTNENPSASPSLSPHIHIKPVALAQGLLPSYVAHSYRRKEVTKTRDSGEGAVSIHVP